MHQMHVLTRSYMHNGTVNAGLVSVALDHQRCNSAATVDSIPKLQNSKRRDSITSIAHKLYYNVLLPSLNSGNLTRILVWGAAQHACCEGEIQPPYVTLRSCEVATNVTRLYSSVCF